MLRHSLNSEPCAREKPHVSRQYYMVERIPINHPNLASRLTSKILSVKSSAYRTHHQSLFAAGSVFLASHSPSIHNCRSGACSTVGVCLAYLCFDFAKPIPSIENPGLDGLNLEYGIGEQCCLVEEEQKCCSRKTARSHQPLVVSGSNNLKHELSLYGNSLRACTALDGNGVRAAIEFAVLSRGGWTRLVMGNVSGGEVEGRLDLFELYCQRSGGCLQVTNVSI